MSLAACLGESKLDDAAMGPWDSLGERPIDFPRVAAAQGFRERSGRWKRARHDEDSRGVTVEAVDQPRPLPLLALKTLEQAVDMASDSRAALTRNSARLVQHEGRGVLVDDKALDEF